MPVLGEWTVVDFVDENHFQELLHMFPKAKVPPMVCNTPRMFIKSTCSRLSTVPAIYIVFGT